jgi:hypothetical protein
VKGARGQWWFTDEGGGTHVKWTYAVDSRSGLGGLLLIPAVHILWRRYMQAAVAAIKLRAEKEIGRR